MNFNEKQVKELANKYQSRLSNLETNKNNKNNNNKKPKKNNLQTNDFVNSKDYLEFKKQFLPPELSRYEQLCKKFGGLFEVNPPHDEKIKLEESISYAHLNITPQEALSFSYIFPIVFMIVSSISSFFIFFILTGGETSLFFPLVSVLIGLFLMNVLSDLPHLLSEQMIMKAGSSMIQAVFYVVTFMRSSSNLELAINFAADHLPSPLSLDFKKVLWDVENGKFSTVKESLDDYLVKWRGKSDDFIEAMHMIESSLYEGTEERRLEILDKSLQLILDGNYNQMLRFARELKGPVAMLNMMGVVLPVLGLVILPMVVSFMDAVRWFHISTLYNLLLPAGIAYYSRKILLKRPAASTGNSDINVPVNAESNFSFAGMSFTLTPIVIALIIGSIFILIGFSPLFMNAVGMPDITFSAEYNIQFLDFQIDESGEEVGPYGLGATLISLSAVIGVGIIVGLSKKLKSEKPYNMVQKVKKLEDEFSSSIYQLANRLGEGMPLEKAFQSVISSSKGSATEEFYSKINDNIRRLGMSVDQALYDPENGALKDYPSPLMHSTMKILIESIKKGPRIASKSLIHISEYSESIKRVNERLKDLMAEVISSIRSQMSMMAPVISGIVVGITSMIISIIGRIQDEVGEIATETGEGAAGGAGMGLMDAFQRGVPAYYFQIVIGIYVITLIAILSKLVVELENGPDDVLENFEQAKNVIRGTMIYSVVSFFTTLGFNIMAAIIITTI